MSDDSRSKKKSGPALATAQPRTMHAEGFVKQFGRIERTMKNRRFAFILGAGASKTSGIKAAPEFVREWLGILYENASDRGSLSYDQWLAKTKGGIDELDLNDLAASYPQAYTAAFGHDPDAGYAYLEDAMKAADPRYGYAVLAFILETTQHKVVITVNFDNLVADALANYAETYPLVCGHDSLAGFAQPNLRRPLILKVHHDLLFGPKSSPEELQKIGDGYRSAVQRILQHYTPIVIGYGGNDGSLMGVLESLQPASIPGGIYWCYRAGEKLPREQIQNLVARQNGSLVPIAGFDEVMAMLGEELKFDIPDQKIKQRAEKRANQLVEHAKQLKERLKATPAPAQPAAAGQPAADDMDESKAAALKSLEATLKRTDGNRRWWQWQALADAEKDPTKADQIYQQGIAELPNSASLLGNYALFLHDVKKDNDRAQEFYERALQANPYHAGLLGNYAGFLLGTGKESEGLPLLERAITSIASYPVPGLDVEVWFYAFAHRPEAGRLAALATLKKLIIEGNSRSPGWDFSLNVQRAAETGHSEARWLPKLAEVINAKADPSVLADWPAWHDAK